MKINKSSGNTIKKIESSNHGRFAKGAFCRRSSESGFWSPRDAYGHGGNCLCLWKFYLKHNPKTRTGSTEIGSYYRMATDRCCITHFAFNRL